MAKSDLVEAQAKLVTEIRNEVAALKRQRPRPAWETIHIAEVRFDLARGELDRVRRASRKLVAEMELLAAGSRNG